MLDNCGAVDSKREQICRHKTGGVWLKVGDVLYDGGRRREARNRDGSTNVVSTSILDAWDAEFPEFSFILICFFRRFDVFFFHP